MFIYFNFATVVLLVVIAFVVGAVIGMRIASRSNRKN